ncbi:MAG: glycosyltransferase [Candidatus Polarisedimenticolaceae bacterium]|nr:glycosyltransferase [Candidatus Polarisedimenticolaceae bacterium]
MDVSIIIRTYNEEKHLGDLLQSIRDQDGNGIDYEVLIVDSGSTDQTLDIAYQFEARIIHICKDGFSFGRSLNMGCEAASGEILVFISGHCLPASRNWLHELVRPLGSKSIVYTYGSQQGDGSSRFSECQLFVKNFGAKSHIPQDGIYCNNANAALLKNVWHQHRFDEELTGLEDMHLSKRLMEQGYRVGYVAEAPVYHLHNESWAQIKRRFEREAIALQYIMPEIQISFFDFLHYFLSAIILDMRVAFQRRLFSKKAREILMYRLMQFWGSYRGNHFHRKLSKQRKEAYFYPR